ncbi:unnamed protein product [Closterium sp. NIES-54]
MSKRPCQEHTSTSTAATEAPTPATTPTPTPSAASTATTAAPASSSSSLAPLALAVAAPPTRSRRSAYQLGANEVDSSSRGNRGQKGDGGAPLKEMGTRVTTRGSYTDYTLLSCKEALLEEVNAVDFEVSLDDLQLFLQCDSKDGLSLLDLTSGTSTAPTADADSTVRSQLLTRDAAARLAVRNHLPSTERAHFSQYKSARALYDAVVARYSSPTTAALSRLMLPYLLPDLAAFATVADLVAHLRTSNARYRVHHPLLPSHPPP